MHTTAKRRVGLVPAVGDGDAHGEVRFHRVLQRQGSLGLFRGTGYLVFFCALQPPRNKKWKRFFRRDQAGKPHKFKVLPLAYAGNAGTVRKGVTCKLTTGRSSSHVSFAPVPNLVEATKTPGFAES